MGAPVCFPAQMSILRRQEEQHFAAHPSAKITAAFAFGPVVVRLSPRPYCVIVLGLTRLRPDLAAFSRGLRARKRMRLGPSFEPGLRRAPRKARANRSS